MRPRPGSDNLTWGLPPPRPTVTSHVLPDSSVSRLQESLQRPRYDRALKPYAAIAELSNPTLLQSARRHGCLWDETKGHLAVLRCASYRRAAALPRVVVRWLRGHGRALDERLYYFVAGGGHLEVLPWLIARGCPWDKTSCSQGVTCAAIPEEERLPVKSGDFKQSSGRRPPRRLPIVERRRLHLGREFE